MSTTSRCTRTGSFPFATAKSKKTNQSHTNWPDEEPVPWEHVDETDRVEWPVALAWLSKRESMFDPADAPILDHPVAEESAFTPQGLIDDVKRLRHVGGLP